jgi:hypothetical protein
LGAFFAIMIVPSSVTPYFECRYCSQFKPVRNPRIARSSRLRENCRGN